jgi:sec-independent protein translocase protein TatA
MFGSLGFPELIIIFVLALLIFGPKKLPDIGRSVGKALGEFRRATNELKNTLEEEVRLDEQKQELKELQSDLAIQPPDVPPLARNSEPS